MQPVKVTPSLVWIAAGVLFASALLAVGPPRPARPALAVEPSFATLATQDEKLLVDEVLVGWHGKVLLAGVQKDRPAREGSGSKKDGRRR